MARIRLIASDLDGTLLLNGRKTLNPGTCELIRRLNREGIAFFAASGRQYASLQRLFSPVKNEIGYLCENGCMAFFQGEMIYQKTMSRELGQEVLHAIWEQEDCEIALSGVHTMYLQPKNMDFYYYLRDKIKDNVTLVQDIFQVSEPYMKISVYEKNGIQDPDYWIDRFGSSLNVVTSGAAWLDMMPQNVSKGLGIRKVMEFLDLEREQVVAFGDNYNDKEMLQEVGFPIAMKTAVPEIRDMCMFETDTVEHALEMLLHMEM